MLPANDMIYTEGQARSLRKDVEERKRNAEPSDGDSLSGRNTEVLIEAVFEIVGGMRCSRAANDG